MPPEWARTPRVLAAMRHAAELAEGVRGSTSPNPPVGCVILDTAGEVVGSGATRPPGGPHAEVVALEEAGARARGGTAVVTLEPCAHTGRTGACAAALRAAGVDGLVYAVSDPNPQASGGARELERAGVAVAGGVLAEEVSGGALRGWLHFVRTGRAHVTWKYAASLDGRSAAADGSSQWITSAEARAEVHRLRAKCDAVMAGTGTVLADDPSLTVRDEHGAPVPEQPLRVVLGDREVPAGFKVLDDVAPTLRLPGGDPEGALRALAERGVVEVFLEGGPTLAGAFLRAGRVDLVQAFVAPALLGSGKSALGEAGVVSISGAWRFYFERVTMCGPDVWISAVPAEG
ncbi:MULTISPECIES: bifunctional diaminohydroxyphosphoribosylaminopyrimidine deaminase/5-amino-6-(5-phosphoribosylamino)uracil reductase RibD [unclassified Actinopolyspora]|uniref:bifunctional diaminohydroxyphosphoribosylaminopyrimidine deaminase/5-amino-6-(5-phosphoribosylamino)uracil reductase RibD n=1 Tax=unclassified Actinopolyspora TaxID=2639451 RepID=UPI0013F68DDB|nr:MULTISPECIES: bifunctional diaminohydroxyphosphoribosylaminopyrimidine deaminase/5-amino-6-(5-phosphoribosylamino)uracil reductase RibD [unclassified Actinopolyspora]NHD17580.1 bifunctional diaminohydroxyphosphoribosylaminopyrimidine deaminase/5-amino-6-(5-phosphoribosylamino)uracil reductase RibD [Actinopolyspora sp. BKK2]NHE76687.1 bifunctional diaminohydroxyphosphoribosylaminopyrimidine deaminase/5-amino-6-(5-phosphoribosylamino)uracil reductase RibD [Actinopolyspora sp. BKK1]